VSDWVLDASALLALLHSEPGGDIVRQSLKSAHCAISSVNLAEVSAKLADRGVPRDVVREALAAVEVEVIEFAAGQALLSGDLREATRGLGLSLGDRACLATALIQQCPVLTADRAWANLNLDIDVRVIR
jgi:ribonuclease VapC